MGMQYDVKSAYASASGSLVTTRNRLKSFTFTTTSAASGTLAFFETTTKTGTSARVSTTATITCTAHGLTTGDYVYLDFAATGPADGRYQVTVTDANTFTVTVTAAGADVAVTVYTIERIAVGTYSADTSMVLIPGEGVLFEEGIFVSLPANTNTTIFYG
jgi:hypothetical protein